MTNYKYDEDKNTEGYNTMIKPHTTTHTEAHTKPHNVPLQRRKKPKNRRVYQPMATEVNMGKDLVHSGYSNEANETNPNATSGIKQSPNNSKGDVRRTIRNRSAPMKRRSWKRRYSGTAYPYPQRNMTPEIMAISSSLEDYTIGYYDSVIDSIEKSLDVTGLDNVLKDRMVDWLVKHLKEEIDIMGVVNAIEFADEVDSLAIFRKDIEELQIEKMLIIKG